MNLRKNYELRLAALETGVVLKKISVRHGKAKEGRVKPAPGGATRPRRELPVPHRAPGSGSADLSMQVVYHRPPKV